MNTYIGRNTQNFEKSPAVTVDRVIVNVGESAHYSPSGLTDEQWYAMTGKIVSIDLPMGTQAIADSILATLSARAYQPYKATCAELDPAAELGDWVTTDGVYSLIAKRKFYLDSLGTSDVSADTENTVTDKYPYLGAIEADTARKIAEISSRLTVAEGAITSEVTARTNADTALGTRIDQRLDSITLTVSGTSGTTSFQLKDGSTVLDTETFDLHVKSVNVEGTITADYVEADGVGTGTLTLGDKSTAGKIWFSKTAVIQGQGTNNKDLFVGTDDDLWLSAGEELNVSSYSDAYIGAGGDFTLSASGDINLSSSTIYTGETISMDTSSWGISEISSSGNIQLSPSSSGYVVVSGAVCGYSSLRPLSNGDLDLGSSSVRWGDAYCVNNAWSTSDKNAKTDINYSIDSMDSFFDKIKPCSYKLVDGTSGRTHYGFIAQDIEDNLISEGLTGMDFAGFGKSIKTTPEYDEGGHWVRDVETDEYTYFLRYGEFIALCISQIQKLKARVAQLEAEANLN